MGSVSLPTFDWGLRDREDKAACFKPHLDWGLEKTKMQLDDTFETYQSSGLSEVKTIRRFMKMRRFYLLKKNITKHIFITMDLGFVLFLKRMDVLKCQNHVPGLPKRHSFAVALVLSSTSPVARSP